MEINFKNKFMYTKDYYNEYYKYICFKRPCVLIVEIIFIVNFIISILSMIFPKLIILDINIAMANIATVLILLCFQFYIFYRNTNLEYNRDLELNNGKPIEVELLITEEEIKIYINYEKNVKFSNIEKVLSTKNYYFLITKTKLRIAIKKDSFTKGTLEQFEQFLKQKKF